jgi:hypothetical protein
VKKSPGAAATQIPRFAAFLAKKKQEQKKPITPGELLGFYIKIYPVMIRQGRLHSKFNFAKNTDLFNF